MALFNEFAAEIHDQEVVYTLDGPTGILGEVLEDIIRIAIADQLFIVPFEEIIFRENWKSYEVDIQKPEQFFLDLMTEVLRPEFMGRDV
mgnify:CR=1 FL=1